MLKEREYYAKEDNFFPVNMEKSFRLLIREGTWTFFISERTTCKQDKGWINGCGMAIVDIQAQLDASNNGKISKRETRRFIKL